MPASRLIWPPLLCLALAVASPAPSTGAEQTFALSAAQILAMTDQFNAALLAHSGHLGGALSLRGGAIALASRRCPSVALDPDRKVTRVRILDGPARAAGLEGRTPNALLLGALASMGGAGWSPPAEGRTRRAWIIEPAVGIVGFATAGYAIGDSRGGIDASASADTDLAFLARVNLADTQTAGPVNLVLAITTELPARRQGGHPKRTVCTLLAPLEPIDLEALGVIVASTALGDATRLELSGLLADASGWLAKGRTRAAAVVIKQFTVRVASLSAAEIPPEAAEALVTRALALTESLSF